MTNRSKPGHHVTLLNFRRFRGFATERGPVFQYDTKTDNYLTKTDQKNLSNPAPITAFGGPACLLVLVFDICRVDRAFFPGRLFIEHRDNVNGTFSIVRVQQAEHSDYVALHLRQGDTVTGELSLFTISGKEVDRDI